MFEMFAHKYYEYLEYFLEKKNKNLLILLRAYCKKLDS